MIGRLHIITDYFFQQTWSHAELAEVAVRSGADTIQFRQKSGVTRHRFIEAQRVMTAMRAASAEPHVPLIINDDVSMALAVGARGVHLGQDDFPITAAKTVLGSSSIVGATATSLSQARRAEQDGADYIGFGPVFQTRSKMNPASVKGLEGLASVCEAVSIPVIAIGGIHPEHVGSVLRHGAYGIAVMTAVSQSMHPGAVVQHFRREIDAILAM